MAIANHSDRPDQRTPASAEAAGAASVPESRFRGFVESTRTAVWVIDAFGCTTYTNPGVTRLLGFAAEELSRRAIFEFMTAGSAIMARTEFGAVASGEPLELEFRRKDGALLAGLAVASPIARDRDVARGAVVTITDITSRKSAEHRTDRDLPAKERDSLLASLEIERTRLASVFEHAPAFLAVLRGPTHIFERANPAYDALTGYRNVIGLSVWDALPEVRDQGFIELLDDVRATGQPFIARRLPVRLARVRGVPLETRYIDMVYQRLPDPDGEDRVVAHGVDVTEQVVAENALRETEQRLRDQFAKLPVPTFLWEKRDDDFVLVDMNDAADPLLEPHWLGAIGRTATDLFPGGWDQRADAIRCLRDGKVVRRTTAYDPGPGREPRSFDLTIGPQLPNRVIVHSVETTEQVRTANELRQAQKMEAVGQLAGGVAHDFNNLLTVIGAHTSFLIEAQIDAGIPETDSRRTDSLAIQDAANRAGALTRQLLAFSRKQIMMSSIIDLNGIVGDTHRLLGRLLGEDIEVVLTLSSDLEPVLADAGQIEQVLMNLVLNARDAMVSGGCVSITTRNVTVNVDARGNRGTVPPGRYSMLSVADTGSGMDAATKTHLFEPFFTTKGIGKGTGLGLSTVHGIVTQSSGYITVESAPGEGATFCVYFPVASAGAVKPSSKEEPRPVSGRETVLLVEDDPSVREIVRRILVRAGYQVLEAKDGSAAVAVSASYDRPIDAVITDAVMPGMSGVAVLDYIRTDRPNCKGILMSGHTDDEMTRRGINRSDVTFVQKPFTPADFARRVRAALDA